VAAGVSGLMAANKIPEDFRLYVLHLVSLGVPRKAVARRYGIADSSIVGWQRVAAKPRYTQCAVCGEWIAHRTYGGGNRRKYCEGECQRLMRVGTSQSYRESELRPVQSRSKRYEFSAAFCEVCNGQNVERPNGGFYACQNSECKRIIRNAKNLLRWHQRAKIVSLCVWCFRAPRLKSRKVCSDDCYRQRTNHGLAHGADLWCVLPLCCECGLVKGINNAAGLCRGCLVGYSKRANARARIRGKGQVREAAYRDGDPITREGVIARVGRRCHLCKKLARLDVGHLHPLAAEVDHLIPISKGGDNVWDNVAIAHRACNVKKGNKAAGDQLRLLTVGGV